jgi:hypothetical protein
MARALLEWKVASVLLLCVTISLPVTAAKEKCDPLAAALNKVALRKNFLAYRDKTPPPLRPGLTTEQENRRYEEFLKNLPKKNNNRFVVISIGPFREMNSGGLESKEDADAARNLFREIFLNHIHTTPFFKSRVDEQFIGFKTIELALSPPEQSDIPQFEGMLSGIFRDAQLEFDLKIHGYQASTPGYLDHFREQAGAISDFRAWHKAASGVGHPDFAAAQIKLMQYNPERAAELIVHRFDVPLAQETLERAERSRKFLQSKFRDTPLLAPYGAKKESVLSRRTLEVLRSVKNLKEADYLKEVIPLIQRRLKVTLEKNDALHLRQYAQSADCFSPPVREVETVKLDFESARHGMITVDFGGQGHINTIDTMGALIEATSAKEPSAVQAVLLARKYDEKSTARLKSLESRFQKALLAAGIEDKAVFSGDDGGVVLSHPLKPGQYDKLLGALVNDPDLMDYRIVHSPPANRRPTSNDHTRAEKLAKGLREYFEDHPSSVSSPVTFASEANLATGEILVRIVGRHTPQLKKEVAAALVGTFSDYKAQLIGK